MPRSASDKHEEDAVKGELFLGSVNLTEFVKHGKGWSAQVTARRSDGEHFYVNVRITGGGVRKPCSINDCILVISDEIRKALRKLEEFRNCQCRVGFPCQKHGL
jgi:hypothetical protein